MTPEDKKKAPSGALQKFNILEELVVYLDQGKAYQTRITGV